MGNGRREMAEGKRQSANGKEKSKELKLSYLLNLN